MLTSNKRCLSISIRLNAQCCGTQISSSRPWKNLEKNRRPPKRKLCKDNAWRGGTPASKLHEAGLTIGKRIPAPSNDWALTIALSLTGKNFSAVISACSNKRHGLETPEQPGIKFIGARPVVNNTNIDIYLASTMPSTTLLTPINAPLVSLKVLIQNGRTR